jgi:hypothetical protein
MEKETAMATPSISAFQITGDPILDVTENGYVWYFAGTNNILNWSTSGSDNWNYSSWFTTAKINNFKAIFNTVSDVANISFNYLGYFSSDASNGYIKAYNAGSDMNISFAYTGDNVFPSRYSTAFCYFPTSLDADYPGSPGDMWLNASNSFIWSQANYNPGGNGFYLVLHEALHGLGLKHPHDDGGTGRPTYTELGLKYFDRQWFSVMSYDRAENGGDTAYSGSMPKTPMLFDVVALQDLYGESKTHADNDTYDMILHLGNWYETIWDSGGYDRLDFSSCSDGVAVFLGGFNNLELPHQAGYFTTVADELAMAAADQQGIAVPNPQKFGWLYGEFDEVIGTVYDDLIGGNTLDNFLAGLGGDDLMDGDIGIDYAGYLGIRSSFSINRTGPDVWVAADKTGYEGTDELYNIERLVFDDKNIALDLQEGGHAAQAVELIAASIGKTYLSPDFIGLFLNAFDNGYSMQEVAAAVITTDFFKNLAGSTSNIDFTAAIYKNLVGTQPTPSYASYLASFLQGNGGSLSQTDFLVLCATSEINQNNINLAGLQQTGVEYL